MTIEFKPGMRPSLAPLEGLPTPRFVWRCVFIALLLLAAGGAIRLRSLAPLDSSSQLTLLVLGAAILAAEIFTLDFPDRKRISGGYVFALLASAVVNPAAGVIVAGSAGFIAGAIRGDRLRSALFHGPRLVLAAAAAAYTCVLVLGGVSLEANARGALTVLLYAAVYTVVAWGLACIEEALAERAAAYGSVDVLTNLLLVPLPVALAGIYARTNLFGLQLSALALALLLVIVRAYVNLTTLHRELKQAYARLAEQEQLLEQAFETNREMSQVVSHDLRGPLTSVMGYAEMLRGTFEKSEPDLQKQLRYLGSIESNSRRIMGLADKLLDLHRLEQGGQVELTNVDAARLVRQLVDEMQVQADQKHVALVLDLPPDLCPLRTSEWMFREVAENLLSNAIKYTPDHGRVTVRLQARGPEVLLEVEDNGIGMSPEDQARLFTKFFRSGAREVRQESGTGLGLALTRSMIDKLNGRVSVSSQLGQGSRFSVHLPLDAGA